MSQQSSYFLIGGTGFLGAAFRAHLNQRQIVTQSILRGEISNANSLYFNEDFLSRLHISPTRNVIVDFAYTSVPNTSFSDPVKDFSENLYNINSHLAFAARLPNTTYVYISSGGTIYGNLLHREPVHENAANTPLSPYGITKLASEKYCLMYKEIYGIEVKIVRPSNIYGPGQKPFRGQGFVATALAKMVQRQRIQLFGDGSIVRDYLYVDDFCDGLLSIVEAGENGGIYNLGSETGYTMNEVLDLMGQVVPKQKMEIEYLDARPFDVQYNVLDCSLLRKINTKYYKTDLERGLFETYKWLKDHMKAL